jgi:hypothetical protein
LAFVKSPANLGQDYNKEAHEFARLEPVRRFNPDAPLDSHWHALMLIFLGAQFGLIAP